MAATKALAIDLLRIDAGTQNRIAIDEDTVDDYAAVITESGTEWPFPPLDVFHDGTVYFVGDGFHRLLGAQRAKRGSLPCKVRTGTAADAKIFGMTANDRHGLRMTRADKRACVEWLLDHCGKLAQVEIAEKAGVTSRHVRTIVADRKSKLSESSRNSSGSNAETGQSAAPSNSGRAGGPGHGAQTQHQAGESRDAHPSARPPEEESPAKPIATFEVFEEGWVKAFDRFWKLCPGAIQLVIRDRIQETTRRGSGFQPPTVSEVRAYCEDRTNGIDAETFVTWYDSVGWKVGGNKKMVDWKKGVQNWENRKRKAEKAGNKNWLRDYLNRDKSKDST